jgi:hypothetical protein
MSLAVILIVYKANGQARRFGVNIPFHSRFNAIFTKVKAVCEQFIRTTHIIKPYPEAGF